ncbi:hypothetical protein M422DRAFT_242526 [Sphaerobolus stellatus SS14]|nr:hypothetical protein M422DRAFT_242526 [Sphaerobolus stellatus SS14]
MILQPLTSAIMIFLIWIPRYLTFKSSNLQLQTTRRQEQICSILCYQSTHPTLLYCILASNKQEVLEGPARRKFDAPDLNSHCIPQSSPYPSASHLASSLSALDRTVVGTRKETHLKDIGKAKAGLKLSLKEEDHEKEDWLFLSRTTLNGSPEELEAMEQLSLENTAMDLLLKPGSTLSLKWKSEVSEQLAVSEGRPIPFRYSTTPPPKETTRDHRDRYEKSRGKLVKPLDKEPRKK